MKNTQTELSSLLVSGNMYFLEEKKKAENLRELRHHKNQILKGLRKTKLSKKIQDVINTTKGPSQTLTNSVF